MLTKEEQAVLEHLLAKKREPPPIKMKAGKAKTYTRKNGTNVRQLSSYVPEELYTWALAHAAKQNWQLKTLFDAALRHYRKDFDNDPVT